MNEVKFEQSIRLLKFVKFIRNSISFHSSILILNYKSTNFPLKVEKLRAYSLSIVKNSTWWKE